MRTSRSFLLLVVSSCMLCHLWAQDYRARVTGRVTDPTGSAVPGVTVELTHKSTSRTLSTKSNEAGIYLFQFLDPGEYTMRASETGFKTYVRDGIVLQTGQQAGIGIELELGQVTESLTVTSEAALLDTESASRGLVANLKAVQELPIRARNPLLLANNLPGTTFRGVGAYPQPFANGAIVAFAISGGSPAQNELLVDGAPNTARAAGQQNNIALTPVAESVEEVSVITNAYDASYGRTSGGVINMLTRGGSSQFHATGWGFLRRKAWNANSFPLNAIGQPRAEQSIDQYGFQVDGPVIIPKLIEPNDRFKLFFLTSWENYTELFPQPIRQSVPTPEMRQGDFSKLTNANGDLIRIFDPLSGTTNSAGQFVRTPFTGNIIPGQRINPVAAAVTKYYLDPNDPGLPNQRYSSGNFSLPLFSYDFLFWNSNTRIDANIGDNNRLFFRYSTNRHTQERTLNGILGKPGEEAYNPFLRENNAVMVDWVRVLSPTTTMNVRANYARYVEGQDSVGNFGFDPTSLGLPSSLPGQLAVSDFFGVWQASGYMNLGFLPLLEYNNTYSLIGSLTKVHRSHTLKMGVDVRRWHYPVTNLGQPFRIQSNAGFTREVWNNSASEVTSGDSYASFLLGAPASGNADFAVRPFWRSWYVAPYIQDDWKVNGRLTLNLGLRWDYNTPPDEKHNRLVTGFDPEAASPLVSQIPAEFLELYPNLRQLRGGLRFAGVDGQRTKASDTYFATMQVRAGAAFKLSERLVLRGGYGNFFANWPNGDFYQTQGFSAATPLVSSLDGGRTPIPDVLSDPFPTVYKPVGAAAGLATFVGNNFGWWTQDARLPHVRQFSFGVQYRVSRTSSIDISYVGSRTSNLMTSLGLNLVPDSFVAQCDPSRGGNATFCNAQVPNPFQGIPAFAGTSMFTATQVSRLQMNRPFPQFSGDLNQLGRYDGKMWYNSAQLTYRLRLSGGVVVDANYTFSKQISQEGWLNQYAAIPQRGLTLFDRPHALKVSAHYELPFGRGRAYGSTAPSFVRHLISGWDINAFYSANSGEPADLPGNAIMLRDPKIPLDRNQTIVRGWNPCVLQTNADGTITPTRASTTINGCSATDLSQYAWLVPRQEMMTYRTNPLRSGQIRMPANYVMDMSVNKTTNITERLRFQFRVEAFNAFNHFNIFTVRYNTNPLDANGNFGSYLPSAGGAGQLRDSPPRSIQLGMKLMW